MVKTIDTLVSDMNSTLEQGVEAVPEELIEKYQQIFGELLRNRFNKREARATLRMSNAGKPCEKQLHYEVNSPEKGEPLRPETYMKFLFGDTIEVLLLFLVELSGHTVEGTQDTQEIEGIKGHRDAVIDGVVVDVKSASSYSFKKFSEGRLADDDAFGYIDQIQGYLYAGQDDPVVRDKDRAAFLVLDKVLGHICLDIHQKSGKDYSQFYKDKIAMVDNPTPPVRSYNAIPEGKSGNMKLGVQCSYCPFKKDCWPDLRTFLYSYGPLDLVKVVREPNVPEVKRQT